MYAPLTHCPVCQGELSVSRLYCRRCDTTIEGHFQPAQSPFGQLSAEQMTFVLNFVRCEGRFNRLEEELNLSYPTLRNRLNEVIRALGYEPGREESPPRPSADERRQILADLEEGKISAEEAQALLRGKRGEA